MSHERRRDRRKMDRRMRDRYEQRRAVNPGLIKLGFNDSLLGLRSQKLLLREERQRYKKGPKRDPRARPAELYRFRFGQDHQSYEHEDPHRWHDPPPRDRDEGFTIEVRHIEDEEVMEDEL